MLGDSRLKCEVLYCMKSWVRPGAGTDRPEDAGLVIRGS